MHVDFLIPVKVRKWARSRQRLKTPVKKFEGRGKVKLTLGKSFLLLWKYLIFAMQISSCVPLHGSDFL
jgi:hypothetical protein